ncbi:MAG: 4-hydroxy-2-oxovalerate aldolase [Lentisphaerae bacterium]|jgi:4-hydroxy-2-oxoheptanedioate aldolase|nr:4-hydroxy-2-oxovalerate aldolase [Lentisphaerota bacterium]
MRKSKVLARLRADKPVLMTNISMGVNTMAVEMAGLLGFHAVWLDMEHRSFTWRETEMLVMAARLGDLDALVRIRKQEGYVTFQRPLQEGAAGLMVPHVRSPEEAARWVEYGKYAPVGRRGFENVMRDADMGLVDSADYLGHANRETFLALQIEDIEAVEAVDEIAAVPGFEILFVGPGDLSNGYGVIGQARHARVMQAIERVAAAAARHGKWWGLPVTGVDEAARFAAMGGRFFNIGSDYGWIRTGLTQVRDAFAERFGLDA